MRTPSCLISRMQPGAIIENVGGKAVIASWEPSTYAAQQAEVALVLIWTEGRWQRNPDSVPPTDIWGSCISGYKPGMRARLLFVHLGNTRGNSRRVPLDFLYSRYASTS